MRPHNLVRAGYLRVSSFRRTASQAAATVLRARVCGSWTEPAGSFPSCPDSLGSFLSSLPPVFWNSPQVGPGTLLQPSCLTGTCPPLHYCPSRTPSVFLPSFNPWEVLDSPGLASCPQALICDCHPGLRLRLQLRHTSLDSTGCCPADWPVPGKVQPERVAKGWREPIPALVGPGSPRQSAHL